MKVAYFGFHGEPSGYGVATGLHVRALQRAGVTVAKLQVHAAQQPRLTGVDIAVVQVPADQLLRPLAAARKLTSRVVLFSVWEVEQLPEGWEQEATHADALWVPSRLAERAFAAVPRPRSLVPHPVAVRTPERRRFPGIRDTDTVFFAAMDWQARKNPEGVLRAFMRAFRGREDVVLLLKVSFLSRRAPEPILATIEKLAGRGLPRVVVLVETMPRLQLMRALARADVLISLHRAEGFGLVVAEASARGIPAVCSATGGPLDFLTAESAYLIPGTMRDVGTSLGYPFHPTMRWLEPDLDATVEALRTSARDVADRRRRGRRAQELARELLDPGQVGQTMRRLLERGG